MAFLAPFPLISPPPLPANSSSLSHLKEASLFLILVAVLLLALSVQLFLALALFEQRLAAGSGGSWVLTLAWGASSEAAALLSVHLGSCGGFWDGAGGVLGGGLYERGLA